MAQQIKITQTSNADMNIGVYKTLTAVEWLANELHVFIHPEHGKDFLPILKQAKAMEKEQIMDAHKKGGEHTALALSGLHEQYYNETYNK